MDDKDRIRHLSECDRISLSYWKGVIEALIVRDEEESKKSEPPRTRLVINKGGNKLNTS